MRAVREVWETQFGQSSVIGLAPSAVAASVLGEDLDVVCDNVSKWLYESVGEGAARRASQLNRLETQLETLEQSLDKHINKPNTQHRNTLLARRNLVSASLAQLYADLSKFQLRRNQLLIVDEASMVGTVALAELARQAESAGAKILLVGDSAQLGAVDAGGFLGWMERNKPVSMLNSVWRFSNTWERSVSDGVCKWFCHHLIWR